MLIPKSRAALSRYGHQLVIGNDLHKRKYEVVFVEREQPGPSSPPQKGQGDSRLHGAQTPPVTDKMDGGDVFKPVEQYKETWYRLADLPGYDEIEEVIVKQLLERHTRWIQAGR